jgi:hypothetical protein
MDIFSPLGLVRADHDAMFSDSLSVNASVFVRHFKLPPESRLGPARTVFVRRAKFTVLMPDILTLDLFLARLAVHAHPQDVVSREIGREQSLGGEDQSQDEVSARVNGVAG